MDRPPAAPFRIGFVAGVTPDKWVRRWRERRRDPIEAVPVADARQRGVIDGAEVQMCLVRLPIDPEGLHLIELYAEELVVVLGAEHTLTLLEEITREDLADELVHDGPARTTIETAAAGTGVVVVPRSVARLHARKDVEVRRLVPAPGTGHGADADPAPEESRVGLAWRRDLDDDRAGVFVGIVRGRTERSSRG